MTSHNSLGDSMLRTLSLACNDGRRWTLYGSWGGAASRGVDTMPLDDILMKPGEDWEDCEAEEVFDTFIYPYFLDSLVRLGHGLLRRRFPQGNPGTLLVEAERIAQDKVVEAWWRRKQYDPAKYQLFDPADPASGRRAYKNWIATWVKRAAWTKGNRLMRARFQIVAAPDIARIAAMPALSQASADLVLGAPTDANRHCWKTAVEPFLHLLNRRHQETLKLCRRVLELGPRSKDDYQLKKMIYEEAGSKSERVCSGNSMKTRFCRARLELERLQGGGATRPVPGRMRQQKGAPS